MARLELTKWLVTVEEGGPWPAPEQVHDSSLAQPELPLVVLTGCDECSQKGPYLRTRGLRR